MTRCLAVVLTVAAVAAHGPTHAQDYPVHPIRIVVPYPTGGPADTVARVTTEGLGAELGGSVIIEDLPGAGGRLATKDVTRAAADGYTLLLGSSNEYAITPALYKLDYDPVKELAPVAALVSDSIAIVVNPSLPVHSLKELVAYAKEHPGKLTSGATVGIVTHLALMYFRAHMGADMLFVPYKGAAPALSDAIGNQIQVTASAKSVLLPLIKAGKLRALAVSSTARWPELPDVQTFREAGLGGFPGEVLFGLMAPAGTPADVILKLDAAEDARLRSPEVEGAVAKLGMQIAQTFAKEAGKDIAAAQPPLLAIPFGAPSGDSVAQKLADSTFAQVYGRISISHHGHVSLMDQPLSSLDSAAAVARGRAHEAKYVLYGAVDRQSPTQSLTVKLLSVKDGSALWTGSYPVTGADPAGIATQVDAKVPAAGDD